MAISILHIAPQNTAGLPYEIVKLERKFGFDSKLITMWKHPYGFKEDECLELPAVAGPIITRMQKLLRTTPQSPNKRRTNPEKIPPEWNGHRFPSRQLFAARDFIWEKKMRKLGFPERLYDYDIIVLDSGIPLLRSCKWISQWTNKKSKLSTFYYGTDLRWHGVLPQIANLTKAVFVFEFDHIALYPKASWLPYPFDTINFHSAKPKNNSPIRIGHAALRRSSKGTDIIIDVLKKLQHTYNIEPVLIERVEHQKALRLKASCDIFIDQLGELGYGISGLESLAMGIPTVVELLQDHEKFLGDHPFINANANNLEDKLISLIEDFTYRDTISRASIEWVKKFHNPERTMDIILTKYKELDWI